MIELADIVRIHGSEYLEKFGDKNILRSYRSRRHLCHRPGTGLVGKEADGDAPGGPVHFLVVPESLMPSEGFL